MPPVTARAEILRDRWTVGHPSTIVPVVTVLRLLDLSSVAFVAFAPPTLVWAWGNAVEQLAIGIERLDTVMRQRRELDPGSGS